MKKELFTNGKNAGVEAAPNGVPHATIADYYGRSSFFISYGRR
jgi:hypothetical protein